MKAALLGAVALLLVTGCGGASASPAPLPIHISVRHSKFVPDIVSVPARADVVFVIRNTDVIPHEFIVGDDAVHARHETGTEPAHGDRPGEVSLPPRAERRTTFSFGEAGIIRFACHLPGHVAYGMAGAVVITPGPGPWGRPGCAGACPRRRP